jgi:DNA-binding PadR family transcriptional regulator
VTPYEIGILLHVYACRGPFTVNTHAPIFYPTLDQMQADQLIRPRAEVVEPDDCSYEITDRGMVYVEALTNLPLPVWAMPKQQSAEDSSK